MMDIFDWIERAFAPGECTSDRMFYDLMESQSLECLPIVYQPFDPAQKSHWQAIGTALDFVYSTGGEGKKLLDFGPGDGWPSLIVAPYAKEVIGVDSSKKRVEVCTKNAMRLDIHNAEFVYYEPTSPLPFEDESFDGIIASTSVEQSPDPKKTLEEFYRILKPGGKIRLDFEPLSRYGNGLKKDLFVFSIDNDRCRLILYDRDIYNERVRHVGFTFSKSMGDLINFLKKGGEKLSFDMITDSALDALRSSVIEVNKCTLTHPSLDTLFEWLHVIGFCDVTPAYSGSGFVGGLFNEVPDSKKKMNRGEIEAYLKPIIKVVSRMPAPGGEYQREDLKIRAGKE